MDDDHDSENTAHTHAPNHIPCMDSTAAKINDNPNMNEALSFNETSSMSQQNAHDILLIEPFYCGSHKQLMDCLMADAAICGRAHLTVMSGKKWHWRARTSALYFSRNIPFNHHYKVLFASSVLNLAELTALRPDLAGLHKVIYFHENQLQYPVRKHQERDFQYGYNQVMSCLVADTVLFNSKYNMESFLCSIKKFFKLMPDYRPKDLEDDIRPKCRVLYFPMHYEQIKQFQNETKGSDHHKTSSDASVTEDLPQSEYSQSIPVCMDSKVILLSCQKSLPTTETEPDNKKLNLAAVGKQGRDDSDFCILTETVGDRQNFKCLHIVWPHRWEHDKDPQTFFQVLYKMHDEKLQFTLSIVGEAFTDIPEIFEEAKVLLKDHIKHWGFQTQKSDYFKILQEADIVVSTSKHEFFGVAMLEAVYLGCYPLCPRSLVYPEIYPDCYLYSTSNQLYKRLRSFSCHPHVARLKVLEIDLERFSWETLRTDYLAMLRINI